MIISDGGKGVSEIFFPSFNYNIFHLFIIQRDLMNNSTCPFLVSFIIISVYALYN